MIRTLCSTVIGGLMATSAFADVTVTAQMVTKMGNAESVEYIKGLKMRSDMSLGGTPMTTIIDLENQKFTSINHKKKEAVVYDMAKFRQELDKTMKSSEGTASLKPNGETKEFGGKSCTGYVMNVTTPMAMGQGMEMTMIMSGPVFIARGAPGSADFKAFYLAAAEKGFIASDPRAIKGAAAQTKGMTNFYKAIAETGGLPYYMESAVKIEGGGPMAGMMNKMVGGNAAFTKTVTGVSTDAIGDDKFQVPADYKVKTEK